MPSGGKRIQLTASRPARPSRGAGPSAPSAPKSRARPMRSRVPSSTRTSAVALASPGGRRCRSAGRSRSACCARGRGSPSRARSGRGSRPRWGRRAPAKAPNVTSPAKDSASQVGAWLERDRSAWPADGTTAQTRRGTRYGPLTSPVVSTTSRSRPVIDVELVHDVVVEARVAHAADVPGRAVVGQDHAVALERLGDDPRLR